MCIDQAHVSLVEPLICSEPAVPREVVEAQLDELDYTLDIIELFPVVPPDDMMKVDSSDESLKQLLFIAQVVDNVRYV